MLRLAVGNFRLTTSSASCLMVTGPPASRTMLTRNSDSLSGGGSTAPAGTLCPGRVLRDCGSPLCDSLDLGLHVAQLGLQFLLASRQGGELRLPRFVLATERFQFGLLTVNTLGEVFEGYGRGGHRWCLLRGEEQASGRFME